MSTQDAEILTLPSNPTAQDVIDMALEIIERRFRREGVLTSPQDAQDYLSLKLGNQDNEVFACIFLDTKHRVIAYEELFHGTIDGASVYTRVIVKKALQHNAGAVILAHNHPSGVAEPSRSDESITRKLKDALAMIDVRVPDHIVIGGSEAVSLAERGII